MINIQRDAPILCAKVRPATEEDSLDPVRQFPGDAGFDLTVSRDVTVHPSSFASIPTNLCIALPPDVWALLVGRSSAFYKRNLLVNTGIIDSGYRGELCSLVYNPMKRVKVVVKEGERIAQLILMPNTSAEFAFERVSKLPDADPKSRGTRSFGSSGGYSK